MIWQSSYSPKHLWPTLISSIPGEGEGWFGGGFDVDGEFEVAGRTSLVRNSVTMM